MSALSDESFHAMIELPRRSASLCGGDVEEVVGNVREAVSMS
jgi:hypothetical protein